MIPYPEYQLSLEPNPYLKNIGNQHLIQMKNKICVYRPKISRNNKYPCIGI